MAIVFDTKELEENVKKLLSRTSDRTKKVLMEIAWEVLRLGEPEVPHDEGMLQASGKAEPEGDEVIVGYNKVYAARLHENPQFNFQKGRKGKYLEDPIKRNQKTFLQYYKELLK